MDEAEDDIQSVRKHVRHFPTTKNFGEQQIGKESEIEVQTNSDHVKKIRQIHVYIDDTRSDIDSVCSSGSPPRDLSGLTVDKGSLTSYEPDLELEFDQVINVDELEGIDEIEVVEEVDFEKLLRDEKKKRHKLKKKKRKTTDDLKETKHTMETVDALEGNNEIDDTTRETIKGSGIVLREGIELEADNCSLAVEETVVDLDKGKDYDEAIDDVPGHLFNESDDNDLNRETNSVPDMDDIKDTNSSDKHTRRKRRRKGKKNVRKNKGTRADSNDRERQYNNSYNVEDTSLMKETSGELTQQAQSTRNRFDKKEETKASKHRKHGSDDRKKLKSELKREKECATISRRKLSTNTLRGNNGKGKQNKNFSTFDEGVSPDLPNIQSQLAKILGMKANSKVADISIVVDTFDSDEEEDIEDTEDLNKTGGGESMRRARDEDIKGKRFVKRAGSATDKGFGDGPGIGMNCLRSTSLPLMCDMQTLIESSQQMQLDELRQPMFVPVRLPVFPVRQMILKKQFKHSM